MPPKSTNRGIGRRLAAARLQRGLSQGSVARRAGLAPAHLSRIETGKVHPTFHTVMRIATVLKVPLQELAISADSSEHDRGPCPLTSRGRCMLDLIRSELEVERGVEGEAFTPRQVRLLRRFAAWLQGVPPDRLRAMEVLLEELTRSAGVARGAP